MPLKSWAFMHDGHVVRAEIWWRLMGWNRKRVYVDHNRVVSVRGRFTARRPLLVGLAGENGPGGSIAIRFKPGWFRLDMECELSAGGGLFAPVRNAFVDKHWQVLGWDVDHEPQSSRNFGCMIIFPILLIMVPLYPVLMIVGGLIGECRDRVLRRRLRLAGRYLSWDEIQQRMLLMQSPCTLIQQIGNLARRRVWWTSDDVAIKTVLPLPSEGELLHPSRSDHPLITWCDGKYFHSSNGTAFLTDVPGDFFDEFELFDESDNPSRTHGEYPSLNIVSTGYPTRQSGKISVRFCEILGDNLEGSLPRLVEAIGDVDRELRRVCLKSIGFLGEAAHSAVAILKERFYFGAEGERYLVADTLAKLGLGGLEALSEASRVGDPRIRGHAKSAIRRKSRPVKPVERIRKPRVPIDPVDRKKRIWRERFSILIVLILNAAVIALIVVSGWYLGTIVTLVIFTVLAVSTVRIFIGWQFWRIKKRTKKRLAELAAAPSQP